MSSLLVEPLQGLPQILRPEVWQDQLVVILICRWDSHDRSRGGSHSGGAGPFLVLGLNQVHPRFAMDRLRGVWTSQDQRPEERTKASESAMVVMD
jgi:hypothetical protein